MVPEPAPEKKFSIAFIDGITTFQNS